MKPSEYLENVKKKPQLFINPVTQQNLKPFTDGFNIGYILAKDNLEFHDLVRAWQYVIETRGWQLNAFGPNKEMTERGLSEQEIIDELLQIEIEVWKLLEEKIF